MKTVYVAMEKDEDGEWYCQGVYMSYAKASKYTNKFKHGVIHVTSLRESPVRTQHRYSPTTRGEHGM